MHPDRHSPDDSSLEESRRIEQRLRALQPRPTTLDAHSVLREARRREPPTSLVDGAARPSQAPSTPWLALSAAGGCGAFMGAALTCLVMLSFQPWRTTTGNAGNGSVTAARPAPPLAGNGDHVKVHDRSPAQSDDRASRDLAGTPVDEQRPAVRETRKIDFPRASGSTSEWLLSESVAWTPWMELRRPHVPGERLVAGNHLPLRSRPLPSSLDDSRPPAESLAPMMDRSEPRNAATETLTLDPDGLLQELLGTPTGSTL